MKIEFSRQIHKPSNKISRKSLQWEPTFSMRTDRQTEVTKLIAAFRNFASALRTQPSDKKANLFYATGLFEMCTRTEIEPGVYHV
jgi:hypothetical protein